MSESRSHLVSYIYVICYHPVVIYRLVRLLARKPKKCGNHLLATKTPYNKDTLPRSFNLGKSIYINVYK